jgi:cysteine desulfurase
MINLDHAATTPVEPAVFDAMQPWLTTHFGNPSSQHAAGQAARDAVERAREQAAKARGVAPLEVIFTSGGTEADNAGVKGLAWAGRDAGRGAHVVTTAIEHHAVGDTCAWLADHQGFEVEVVPVEANGVVDPERLLAAVRDDTVCVAVMAANNEIGTVQPIEVIGPALAERGVPLHVDAVQAIGRVPLDLAGWGVTSLAVSAHKINGPKGVGVWMLRRDAAVEPLSHGGGQERGVRSGTLAVPLIVGCGEALERTVGRAGEEQARLRGLRDRLLQQLRTVSGVAINGSLERRVPHNAHVAVAGVDGEALLLAMDTAGVACSTGSACQSGAAEPSHVLTAVGADTTGAAHLRFACGLDTTEEDVDAAAEAFAAAVKRLREAGGGFV